MDLERVSYSFFFFCQTCVYTHFKYFLGVTALWIFLRGFRIYFGKRNIFWLTCTFSCCALQFNFTNFLTLCRWPQLYEVFLHNVLSLIPRNIFEFISKFLIFVNDLYFFKSNIFTMDKVSSYWLSSNHRFLSSIVLNVIYYIYIFKIFRKMCTFSCLGLRNKTSRKRIG